MRYSHRVAQLQKIAADAAYTHRAATYALRKLAAEGVENPKVETPPLIPPNAGRSKEDIAKSDAIISALYGVNPAVAVAEANKKAREQVNPGGAANDSVVSQLYGADPAVAIAAKKPGMLDALKAYSGSTFGSLQGEKVPAFLKNLTKGQAAGGAAALAALLGGGAYLMNRNSKEQQQAEAAAAIMAAKNLSEEQRRRLLRNLGIGAGAALGGYGLYRSMR